MNEVLRRECFQLCTYRNVDVKDPLATRPDVASRQDAIIKDEPMVLANID